MMDNEEQIIKKVKAGDAVAFQHLLEHYYDMIYRVAYRFTCNSQDAQDIAQDICIALGDKIRKFNGDSSFSTWLYRVVVNYTRDFCKKNNSHNKIKAGYVELEEQQKLDKSEENKKLNWLYKMLFSLEENLKETALLVLSEELSHAEAAKILNCAESTVSWRMSEIRKHLRHAKSSYYD